MSEGVDLTVQERELLEILQKDFPVTERPFRKIGKQLGLSEEEVLLQVEKLRRKGVLRRLGAVLSSKRLGYVSTLIAASVSGDALHEAVSFINFYGEVTHNYLRENPYNDYNLWFTLTAPSRETIEEIMEEIEANTPVTRMLELPAEAKFKLKVQFETGSKGRNDFWAD